MPALAWRGAQVPTSAAAAAKPGPRDLRVPATAAARARPYRRAEAVGGVITPTRTRTLASLLVTRAPTLAAPSTRAPTLALPLTRVTPRTAHPRWRQDRPFVLPGSPWVRSLRLPSWRSLATE